jgi:hypothetical protein
MCSNIPNMVQTFGYINASWTLRADLTAEWVCRVLNHMDEFGYDQATPRIPEILARTMEKRYWIHDFSAGYMQRMLPKMPRQGTQMPWVKSAELSEGQENVPWRRDCRRCTHFYLSRGWG